MWLQSLPFEPGLAEVFSLCSSMVSSSAASVMKTLLVIPACSGHFTDIALESSERSTEPMIFKLFGGGGGGGGVPLLPTTQKFLGTFWYHCCYMR